MRRLTVAEALSEFGENVLSRHDKTRNPIWDMFDELPVDGAVVLEPGEWPLKQRPAQIMNQHYVRDKRKFRTKIFPDGKMLIVRIA